MATVPTPERAARDLLAVFVTHFNCRPGEALGLNNIFGVWNKRGFHQADINPALDYAQQEGWVEVIRDGDSFRLTETGFAQAEDRREVTEPEEWPSTLSKSSSLPSDRPRVFIVYGHDSDSLEKLDHLLRKIGLEPERFDSLKKEGSETVIEILERSMPNCDAVIALLTPDDEGRKRSAADEPPEKREPLRPRARQNVLIEAGYAIISKRRRSLIVALGGVDIPSDFEGIHRLQSDAWDRELAGEIAKRFSQMGFSVNLESVI